MSDMKHMYPWFVKRSWCFFAQHRPRFLKHKRKQPAIGIEIAIKTIILSTTSVGVNHRQNCKQQKAASDIVIPLRSLLTEYMISPGDIEELVFCEAVWFPPMSVLKRSLKK